MSNDKLVDLENRIVQRLAWLREGSLIDVQAFTADIEAMLAQAHAAEAAHTRIPDLTDDEWMILFHERPDLKDRLNAIFDQAAYLSRYRSQCKTSTEAAQPLPQMTDAEHAEILAKYGTAQPAEPAKDARTPDVTDVRFEVWQNDEMVASCSGPEPQALTEAKHYASQYAQDGPVSVFRVSRVRINPVKELNCDHDA